MKFLEKLIRNEEKYQRLLGVTPKQFELLVRNITPLWNSTKKTRLTRENRKRKIGGGRDYSLKTIEEKLAVVLFYYRHYITQEALGVMIDVDQATISRLLKAMLPLIEQAADPELKTYLANAKKEINAKKIKSKEEIISHFPDLKDVSIDATEQQCFRSQDNDTQKQYYSGKKKHHCVKTQISASSTGRILDVSATYPGSVHDKTIIDREKTIEKIHTQVPQRYDGAYQGVKKQYPKHYLITPYKKPKGESLSGLAKEQNRINSKRRIVVEHAIGRIKRFKICSERFRQPIKTHNQICRNIAAISNFKLKNSHLEM